MRSLLSFLFLMSMVAVWSSCGHSEPEPEANILPDTVMADVLVEFAIADAAHTYSMSRPDYPRFKVEMFYDAILKERNSNREQFVKSLEYYSIHTKQLQLIYEQALNDLSRRQAEAVK